MYFGSTISDNVVTGNVQNMKVKPIYLPFVETPRRMIATGTATTATSSCVSIKMKIHLLSAYSLFTSMVFQAMKAVSNAGIRISATIVTTNPTILSPWH
jgi:hypothetical protein